MLDGDDDDNKRNVDATSLVGVDVAVESALAPMDDVIAEAVKLIGAALIEVVAAVVTAFVALMLLPVPPL